MTLVLKKKKVSELSRKKKTWRVDDWIKVIFIKEL